MVHMCKSKEQVDGFGGELTSANDLREIRMVHQIRSGKSDTLLANVQVLSTPVASERRIRATDAAESLPLSPTKFTTPLL